MELRSVQNEFDFLDLSQTLHFIVIRQVYWNVWDQDIVHLKIFNGVAQLRISFALQATVWRTKMYRADIYWFCAWFRRCNWNWSSSHKLSKSQNHFL